MNISIYLDVPPFFATARLCSWVMAGWHLASKLSIRSYDLGTFNDLLITPACTVTPVSHNPGVFRFSSEDRATDTNRTHPSSFLDLAPQETTLFSTKYKTSIVS